MTWRMSSERWPLLLYGVILVLYCVLVGWWVLFFSRQGDILVEQVRRAGALLEPVQAEALRTAASRHTRMLLYEGTFLALLLLGSTALVVRAVRQEARLYRQQRTFLSAVTHELNSPLASARLHVESLLLGRADPERVEHYLRNTLQDLNRLGHMIEDVLATRRLVTGAAALDLEQADLAELVRRRAARFCGHHAVGEARVQVTAPEAVPIVADVAAIEKVIDNLLSNAVKYGGPSPRVAIAARAEAGRAVLEVRDYGAGLQGADPRRILQPFVRGQGDAVRALPGAGLGLYIVSEFVRAHGGELALTDDVEGGGTLVRVTLPSARRGSRGPARLKEAL